MHQNSVHLIVLRGGEAGGRLVVGVGASKQGRIVDLDQGDERDRADGEGLTCGEGVVGGMCTKGLPCWG